MTTISAAASSESVKRIQAPLAVIPAQISLIFKQSFFWTWGWNGLFRRYQADATTAERMCDYVIYFKNTVVLFALPELVLNPQENFAKQLADFQKKTLTKTRKRLERVAAWLSMGESMYMDAHAQQPLILEQPEHLKIFKVCITSIIEPEGQQQIPMLHHYGSIFYHETCVMEPVPHPVQLIGAGEFGQIIDALDNFDDFFAFLDYHEQAIVHEQDYSSESDLLRQFIASGKVFERARAVEQQLLQAQLIDHTTPDFSPTTASEAAAIFELMRQEQEQWDDLICGYKTRLLQVITQHVQQKKPLDADYRLLLSCLADESRASRWKLAHALGLRRHANGVPLDEGMVAHARSYTQVRRHYIFCFYSENPEHPHAKPHVQPHLRTLAEQVKTDFSSWVDEIIVLGVSTMQGMAVAADVLYVRV